MIISMSLCCILSSLIFVFIIQHKFCMVIKKKNVKNQVSIFNS